MTKTSLHSSFLILLLIGLIASCKKNDAGSSVADELVGIWNAKDTIMISGAGGPIYQSYNFTVAKRDDNSVYFLNFAYEDTCIMSVNETALAYISGSHNSGNYVEPNSLSYNRSGNRITYSSSNSSNDVTGAATKQ